MQHLTPDVSSPRAPSPRLSPEQLKRCRQLLETEQVDQIAYEFGFSDEQQCLAALGNAVGLDIVDLSKVEPDAAALTGFPVRLIHRHNVFPIGRSGGMLTLAVGNPFDVQAVDAVSAATGETVTFGIDYRSHKTHQEPTWRGCADHRRSDRAE